MVIIEKLLQRWSFGLLMKVRFIYTGHMVFGHFIAGRFIAGHLIAAATVTYLKTLNNHFKFSTDHFNVFIHEDIEYIKQF